MFRVSTVRVTTSPTQLGFPRKLTRISKDFVLGRKPMKRMLLPQYCIFSHVFHFFSTQMKKKITHLSSTMPKRNKCSQKARECEAAKQGEITLAICTYAKEISWRSVPTQHMKILEMILMALHQKILRQGQSLLGHQVQFQIMQHKWRFWI
jgi:hypothetical protein